MTILNGVNINGRISVGPAGPFDEYWDNVRLLLNGDNPSIIDSSQYNLSPSANNNVATSTAQHKFGTGSLAFDNSADYIRYADTTISNAFGGAGTPITTPFTLEMFIHSSDNTSVVGTAYNNDSYGWNIQSYFGDFRVVNYSAGGGRTAVAGYGGALPSNQWVFIAVSYTGTQTRFYANGVLKEVGGQLNGVSGAGDIRFGAMPGYGSSFTGYLDSVRLTIGTARYIGSTCPVPTTMFPTS